MAAEASPRLPDRAAHDLADAVLVLDPRSLRVVGANYRARDLLGYDFPALQSMPIGDIHPLDEVRVNQFIGETLRDGTGRIEETSCFTVESEFVPAEVVGSPVRHEGEPRVLVVVHDLRHREEFGVREELERVQAVTREFVEDARASLSRVREAVESSEATDTVASSIARVDRLLDALDSVVGDGSNRAHEQVTLSHAVNDARMRVGTDSASIEVVDDVAFPAHRESVLRVLGNILENSVVHADDGVNVEVGVVGPANGFYVQDDGPGIPQSERGRLFSRDAASADGEQFGLLVVERLVAAHGWDIRVEESPSGGARFVVRF